MNRRLSLAALGGAVLATTLAPRLVAAQSVSSMSPDQVRQMALGGMAFAEATSRLALNQAQNPTVRTFAQLEAEEQQAFAAARQMAGLPVPSPQMMDQQKQQMLQQLQGMSGAQFDRMYIQGQVQGHEELLQLHQAMAQSAATREERMLGTVAVPAIRTHLAMLGGITQQMRG
jgi:putative membrane protein